MRVGIYCHAYRPEDGGANSLVSTVLNEIKNDLDERFEYVFIYEGSRSEKYKKQIEGFSYCNINAGHWLSTVLLSNVSRALGIELTFRLEELMVEERIDILLFLSPFYTGIKSRYIFPVWDLGHRTTDYPEAAKWYKRYGRDFMYRKMLANATYVLTGNETGKREIVTYYGTTSSKIKIAPFPVSKFCYGDSCKPAFSMPDKYFFYPAQFWQHKNHIVIVRAVETLKKKYGCTPVVFFTGSDQGNKANILQEIRRCGLEKQVILTGFLKEEELKYLYEHARAMIFASMMGPNNLPPMEALFLGCPVIITNIEGHKEQMGNYAVYFDGNDPTGLASIMYRMLRDDSFRNLYVCNDERLRRMLGDYRYMDSIRPLLAEAMGQATSICEAEE